MKPRHGPHYKGDTQNTKARRMAIEAELASIPLMAPQARALTSTEGFIDYYLRMYDLYPTQYEAYEKLEEYHVAVTGRQRYSDFDSFRNKLRSYLKSQRGKI